MQLISSASGASEEDEEPESISLTIIPPAGPPGPPQAAAGTQPPNAEETQTPGGALFTALSNCSNLHPDPIELGEETDLQDSALFQAGMIAPGSAGGGLPPPMPGSGGWITAENMSEYFDEDGNWIGGEEGEEEQLGPGAGTVRSREEDPELGEEDGNGDDTKWQRTS
jgi:nucleotide-sensitive chloride channel 1A